MAQTNSGSTGVETGQERKGREGSVVLLEVDRVPSLNISGGVGPILSPRIYPPLPNRQSRCELLVSVYVCDYARVCTVFMCATVGLCKCLYVLCLSGFGSETLDWGGGLTLGLEFRIGLGTGVWG